MPNDGVTSESASVLDFVQSGPPNLTVDRTEPFSAISSASLPGMGLSSGIGIVMMLKVWTSNTATTRSRKVTTVLL